MSVQAYILLGRGGGAEGEDATPTGLEMSPRRDDMAFSFLKSQIMSSQKWTKQ